MITHDFWFHLQFVDFPIFFIPKKQGFFGSEENVMSMWFKDAGIQLDKPNACGFGQMAKKERPRWETTEYA